MIFKEHGPPVGGGRYRPLTPLGQGGMGIVWLADDLVLARRVALKILRPEHTAEDLTVRRARALREAHVLARIKHPSIVEIYDMFLEDDHPCIVMAYIEGDSLQDLLDAGRQPGERELASIALGVLGALDAAHRADVLHRDVKPANIMVTDAGKVFLLDFGIAHIIGENKLTSTNMFIGTLELLAPERLEGRDPGPAADLWALGVTLYTMVAGYAPFRRNDNGPATMMAILKDEPPPLRPGPLSGTIARLLVKDPARRLNARALAAELRAIIDPPSSKPPPEAPRPRENPVHEENRPPREDPPPRENPPPREGPPLQENPLLRKSPALQERPAPREKPRADPPPKAGTPPPGVTVRVDLASLRPAEAARVVAGMSREAAAALVDRLPVEAARELLVAADPRVAGGVLLALAPNRAGPLLARLPAKSAGRVLDVLAGEPDRAAEILSMLSPVRAARGLSYATDRPAAALLALLPAPEAARILRQVDRRAAGEIVTALADDRRAGPVIGAMPVEDACDVLRLVPPPIVASIIQAAGTGRAGELLAGLGQAMRRHVDRYIIQP